MFIEPRCPNNVVAPEERYVLNHRISRSFGAKRFLGVTDSINISSLRD